MSRFGEPRVTQRVTGAAAACLWVHWGTATSCPLEQVRAPTPLSRDRSHRYLYTGVHTPAPTDTASTLPHSRGGAGAYYDRSAAIVWGDFLIWRAKGSTTLLPPAPGPLTPCHSSVGHLFLLPRANPWHGQNLPGKHELL